MTVEDRLQTLADALPDGASVTLPVSLIRSWLIQSGSPDPHNDKADMTVAEVASLLSRVSASAQRRWPPSLDGLRVPSHVPVNP